MTGNTLKLLLSVAAFGVVADHALAAGELAPRIALPSGQGVVLPVPVTEQPLVLRLAQDVTVLASPYTWSATKTADGSIDLEGHVPSAETRQTLIDGIARLGTDTTAIASGEPAGFSANAVAALDVLATLDTGKASFDGGTWVITGGVADADKAASARAAFDASPLKTLGATFAVEQTAAATTPAATTAESTATAAAPAAPATPSAPAAPATVSAPAPAGPASDYAWSVKKTDDGAFTFAGSVPNDKLKTFLAGHVSGEVTDNSTVVAGAPPTFVGGALYGLNALADLTSGELSFVKGNWTLSGTAKDDAAVKTAKAELATVDTKAWTFDISTAPVMAAAPATDTTVASPAPAASSDTAATATEKPATPAAEKPAAPSAPAVSDYSFTASKAVGGTIRLSGDVPTEGAKGYFSDLANGAVSGGLTVKSNPPTDFVLNTLGGINALGLLDNGELKLADGKWSLHGKTASVSTRDDVLAALAKLPAAKDFVADDIVGPSPIELCRAQVAAFVAGGGAINFDSGTKFVKGTDAQLDKVAAALAICPDARVDVEGNTDSDGTADANMALSVARSEAVIAALVQRGIKADRLYAVGYGETLPIVPNTTRANKARNRRIEFKVVTQ